MARYYPGFLGALFIILLRIAIGWHFLYEGAEKVNSTRYGKEPFSAEVYLRNANGPFGSFFRGMLPDPTSASLRDLNQVKESWKADVDRIVAHYGFDDAQKGKAQAVLNNSLDWAEHWFHHHENVEKLKKYDHDITMVQKAEDRSNALSFERERTWEARRLAEADRKALIAPIVDTGTELRETIIEKIATAEQKAAAGPIKPEWSSLDVANALTMYGLVAIGICLIAGLFTPFAALCAAAFLAMIYLSMPPWPGLPPNPKTEGHYWIVSKNLIELIACLVIATTPSGHWIGLDALVFGPRRRRRLARRLERDADNAPDEVESKRLAGV
jgi:uncharacterized membrane protein YphA (DoxX/SURF4 family)